MDLPIIPEKEKQSILREIPLPARKMPKAKVAYIMSAFPALTETFILYEILAMEQLGVTVEIYPLRRLRERVNHAEVTQVEENVHYLPFISLQVLSAQWYFLRLRPLAYIKALVEILRGTFGSANFFLGALAIFPKAVRMAYELKNKDVKHIHAHFATHPAVAALVIHQLTGIPFSFTAHGSDLHVERRMLDKKVQAAAFALTISSFNKEIMVKECGEDARKKIHIIHCGVDPQVFSCPADKNESGPLKILCIAAFKDVKGHKYLIEACRLLRERGIDFVCHLIGEGPLEQDIVEQIVKAGLQRQIILLGPRQRQEIVQMLAQADVLVLASVPTRRGKREGIPVVLMEAMASGLPVVASELSGIPELVEDERSGILVPPRDVNALADALQRLNNDADLRWRMGQVGREKVVREFNLSINTAKRANLFLSS